MRLTILHFNDVHGRLEQLPRLFTLVRQARAEAEARGARVLLFDAGDSSDRAAWESDITKGRANFALLEAMGVQASVVGNGEALQWGRRALESLVTSVRFPVLAANLVDSADPSQLAVPGLKGSALLTLGDFKLGLVGATAVFINAYDRFGYRSVDPLPAIRREIESVKARGAQFVLCLSHLGLTVRPEHDPNGITDPLLAEACPEIGAIVSGHSHSALESPLVVGQTPIVQAGDYGKFLGQFDLDLDDETGRVRDFCGTLLPCGPEVPPDPTISATLELVRDEAGRLLDAQIGVAAHDLPHHIAQPSPFANCVADALRELCGADLAIFFNGFASRGLKAGPITRRDLYAALPGPTHVTAAEVSGAQIRRMVERMLASPYRAQSFNPQRNAPPLGLPAHSSNVRLRYRLPEGELTECLIDGAPLDPARRYRLASTFFTLSPITHHPEYDFIGLEPGQRVENFRAEDVLWEIVEGWVKAHNPVN
jgi:2',3'-cyclic-nucleotide 2'-phosphodiesterase (5'-nucleotidase family)